MTNDKEVILANEECRKWYKEMQTSSSGINNIDEWCNKLFEIEKMPEQDRCPILKTYQEDIREYNGELKREHTKLRDKVKKYNKDIEKNDPVPHDQQAIEYRKYMTQKMELKDIDEIISRLDCLYNITVDMFDNLSANYKRG